MNLRPECGKPRRSEPWLVCKLRSSPLGDNSDAREIIANTARIWPKSSLVGVVEGSARVELDVRELGLKVADFLRFRQMLAGDSPALARDSQSRLG